MNRLILADDQVIFRAGAARVLSLEEDMRIVAQCDDAARLMTTVAGFRAAIVIFSSAMGTDLKKLLPCIREAGSRAILVIGKTEGVSAEDTASLHGIVHRCVTGPELVETVRKVSRGQRAIDRAPLAEMPLQDAVGARVRDRLTPRELQIVALISQGCKNKDIAAKLGTKEQVVKNYLRSVYDKTGVSDRLELALFTLHHHVLADAAAKAGTLIQLRTA